MQLDIFLTAAITVWMMGKLSETDYMAVFHYFTPRHSTSVKPRLSLCTCVRLSNDRASANTSSVSSYRCGQP